MASDSVVATQAADSVVATPAADVSPYSKIDKTGFIGFFANIIEISIDFGHDIIKKIGVENSYGYAIILFTILGKFSSTDLIVVSS